MAFRRDRLQVSHPLQTLPAPEAAERAGPTGTWEGSVFCLRKFPASPLQGRTGEVEWTQSLGKIRLVFSSSKLAVLDAEDIDMEMSCWQLKIRPKDRPDLKDLFEPLCGDLFGDVRRELSWWTWEIAEGTATFTLEMTKRDLNAWKDIWCTGRNLHHKQHFGWNEYNKKPARAAEQVLAKMRPGPPSWVYDDPKIDVVREDLIRFCESRQSDWHAEIRLHVSTAALEKAADQVGLEDLLGLDVMENYIRVFIRGDKRNPILLSELGGRVVPEKTTFEFSRAEISLNPVTDEPENMTTLLIIVVKHPKAQDIWPDECETAVLKQNLAVELEDNEAPESLEELSKLLLSRPQQSGSRAAISKPDATNRAREQENFDETQGAPPRPPGRNWTKYSDPDDGDWWHYDGVLGQWWCHPGEAPSPYEE